MSQIRIDLEADDSKLKASLASVDEALKEQAEKARDDTGSQANTIINALQIDVIENTRTQINTFGQQRLAEIKAEVEQLTPITEVREDFNQLRQFQRDAIVEASFAAQERLAELAEEEDRVNLVRQELQAAANQADEVEQKVEEAERKEATLRSRVGSLLAITTGALSLASGIATLIGEDIIPSVLTASITAGVSLAQISLQAAALGTATGNLALIAAGLGIAAGLVNVVNSLRAQQRISQTSFRRQQEAFTNGLVDY
jgi:hypothetical protein